MDHAVNAHPRLIVLALGLALAAGCASGPKRLEYGRADSPAMERSMRYAVYTPPDFRAEERLPLVLFLHGGGDSETAFDRHGIGERLDEAITAGRVPRVVVVLPDGELGFWRNWRDGSNGYRDWATKELMPRVMADYHTQECPDGCHVMGVSMGGSGTMHFLFTFPNLFESAAIISAPIMDTDAMLSFAENPLIGFFIPVRRIWGEPSREQVAFEDPFLHWETPDDLPARIYLAWAEGDRGQIVFGNEKLHEHLAERRVPHAYESFEGGHNWTSWAPVIERALTFMIEGDVPPPARRSPGESPAGAEVTARAAPVGN